MTGPRAAAVLFVLAVLFWAAVTVGLVLNL